LRELPKRGVRRASSPLSRIVCSHGQSRSEDQKTAAKSKAIHADPGKGRARRMPAGAEEEPGQTGAETCRARLPKQPGRCAKSGKWCSPSATAGEGKAGLRDLLGGKGRHLAEMANLGLPVPPGFTIPTSVLHLFF